MNVRYRFTSSWSFWLDAYLSTHLLKQGYKTSPALIHADIDKMESGAGQCRGGRNQKCCRRDVAGDHERSRLQPDSANNLNRSVAGPYVRTKLLECQFGVITA